MKKRKVTPLSMFLTLIVTAAASWGFIPVTLLPSLTSIIDVVVPSSQAADTPFDNLALVRGITPLHSLSRECSCQCGNSCSGPLLFATFNAFCFVHSVRVNPIQTAGINSRVMLSVAQ